MKLVHQRNHLQKLQKLHKTSHSLYKLRQQHKLERYLNELSKASVFGACKQTITATKLLEIQTNTALTLIAAKKQSRVHQLHLINFLLRNRTNYITLIKQLQKGK